MADPAQFGHDYLGHLLADRLLTVPRFQRSYSWQKQHIEQYLDDIERARTDGNSYFMGTVVLASDPQEPQRKLIIDGQQRITTTAILLISARDQLRNLEKNDAASSVQDTYLSNYVLAAEERVAKLTLSNEDHHTYESLLGGTPTGELDQNPVVSCYSEVREFVNELAPDPESYRSIIDLIEYLSKNVQVLLAVATGLQEAYVIFETLNDRGADLTTADLLKNYLFSNAGATEINHAQSVWTRVSGNFEKSEDLVKFLRYEYMSRKGRITHRELYKALQTDVGSTPRAVRTYLDRLEKQLKRFVALREPDDASWSSQAIDVKDSLLAFRRFGLEANTPLLLAAFAKWTHSDATRFVERVANWSIRAWTAGVLGGGVAESSFCNAAVAITDGTAKDADSALTHLKDLIPDDPSFKEHFKGMGGITTTKAKYLLSQIEIEHRRRSGIPVDSAPDWSSKSITVEHILAKSTKREDFDTEEDFDKFNVMRDQIKNLTLLEKKLNSDLDNSKFNEKKSTYLKSAYVHTQEVGNLGVWGFSEAEERSETLAELAVKAWPI